MTTRMAAWLAGAILVVASAFAAALFAIGETDAAIKVALYILLLPGVGLFAFATVGIVRQPDWYRRIRDVAEIMALVGCILVLAPILLYAPWAPAKFPLGDMPFGLPVLIWVGGPLAAAGWILVSAMNAIDAWRRWDWARALVEIFLLGILGFLIVRVISAN